MKIKQLTQCRLGILLVCFTITNQIFSQATNKLDSTGNAGIGTTTPSAKLEVWGNGAFTQQISVAGANGGTSTFWGPISVPQSGLFVSGNVGIGTAAAGKLHVTGQTGNQLILDYSGNGDNYFDASAVTHFRSTASFIESMTILQNGNIGIAAISPSQKFVVGNGNAEVTNGQLTVGTTATNGIQFISDGTLGTIDNIPLMIRTSASERMRITASGYVGIGTSSPAEMLSVDGNVYASGNISAFGFIKTKKLTVTQTAWPDYVFTNNYRLRSLSSLESYIKQNKHLPEVPSAKQVKENGISVGDNQELLLKKIEELTLYIIELNKRIDTLENKKKINIASGPIK
jgi:hypothetical protein